MRVTQSMMSNNMLRNLNNSYGKMSRLQDQMNSGSKINRPSQDPVIAVKGMGYRNDLAKVEQFQRNINEANTWLDTTDEVFSQVSSTLNRVKELTIQAANETNTEDDRQKIKIEIDQIHAQIKDLANTQIGDKYIFSGTHTSKPLYVDGEVNAELGAGIEKDVKIDLYEDIAIKVNTNGLEVFENINAVLGQISAALIPGSTQNNADGIGNLLGDIASGANPSLLNAQSLLLERQADVGARQNRTELITSRLDYQELNIIKQKSLNEDVDYAKAITDMTAAEAVHQASLSVGAKIIQQTLVDFMR